MNLALAGGLAGVFFSSSIWFAYGGIILSLVSVLEY
jgi:hypothetical protein